MKTKGAMAAFGLYVILMSQLSDEKLILSLSVKATRIHKLN